MKKCQYCAEEIQDEAIVCKHCGRDLTKPAVPPSVVPPSAAAPSVVAPQISVPPPKKQSKALAFIIIFLVLCCLISAIIRLGSSSSKQTPTAAPSSIPGTGATVVITTPVDTEAPINTEAPTLGVTRDQPYPVDTVVDIGGDTQISIIFVTRPANEIVVAGNMFNNTPEPNQEYILVRLHLQCNKPANEKCNFSTYELKTVGTNGRVQDQAPVAGVPEELEFSSEMFGGSFIEGSLVFLATKDDPNVVLFYEPLFFGDPIYIALQ